MKRGVDRNGALIVMIILLLTGCSDTEKSRIRQAPPDETDSIADDSTEISGDFFHGGELIISSGVGSPKHLNQALLSGYAVSLAGTQIFASPLRFDENWNPKPYLAKTWEVSEDGLEVTLHLVDNAVFHDGHPVTSEDVAFSISIVKTYHPFKSMFEPVKVVETPDPSTVVIKLAHVHPAILLALSPPLLPILPEHIYNDGQDIINHPANLKPIGCGPYILKEFVPDEYISLERNKHYFIENRPYLDSIIIQLDLDPHEQMVKIKRGEAHLIPGFSDFKVIQNLADSPYLAVTPRGYDAIGPLNWIAFNLLKKPFDNKLVRQAIAYAVDREFITHYLFGSKAESSTGPIAPHSPFYEADVKKYPVDFKKANALLDKAGYPVKSNNIRFSAQIDYLPLVPNQQKELALYLKRQLKKIGIDVTVRKSATVVEWANRVSNWDFDMTLDSVFNWGDPVIGVHRTYMSDNIRKGVPWSNTQNYRNPEVDALLKAAGTELDPEKRKRLYSEFQKILTDEVPIIWINVLPFHTIYHKGLKILPTSIWGVLSPMDNIYWKEKPKNQYVFTEKIETTRESSLIKNVGEKAISLIREKGLFPSLKIMNDPEKGFLEMDISGLHIIGFTKEGIVFLDNSNQMKSGMDMSSILDNNGNKILLRFLDSAVNGNIVRIDSVWPNPATDEAGMITAWCGMPGDNDIICALTWIDTKDE
ncbi:MAG: ABC transporter substrate-binding protein [Spirochaetales bacterium]|nr:ABC transporter substrate-binding protein [Spirochaetales bacterium]